MELISKNDLKKEIHLLYSDDLGILEVIDRKPVLTPGVDTNLCEIGDRRFCICGSYNHQYTVSEGVCKKITQKNGNAVKYTFKIGYDTRTFTCSSFGKKVFNTYEDALIAANKLNEEEK